MSEEFWVKSGDAITAITKDKVIESVSVLENGPDEYLCFQFTDGSILRIRYDYIYEWELIKE